MSIRYQKRASTEPEPSTANVIFIVGLVMVVAAYVVMSWFNFAGDFARYIIRYFGI